MDLDGLDTFEEALLGTSDHDADSDDDGLDDGAEVGLGTDAMNPDTDGDGYSDGQEHNNGGNPTSSADGLGPVGAQRGILTRLNFRGTWPNFSSVPPVPALSVKIGVPPSPAGHELTQANVNTAGAFPNSTMSPVNNTAILDKEITPGIEYPFTMNWSGALGTWPNVWGKAQAAPFPSPPTAYQPANLLFYTGPGVTTATPKGWFISNDDGAVWREADWTQTGFPPANSLINYQLDGRDYQTGKFYAVLFDLDIDSDNTVGADELPQRDLAEDDHEADQAKIIPLNNNEDYEDDLDSTVDNEDLDVEGERDFVPMILEVAPESIPWEKVKIKFKYPGDPEYTASSSEPLRIWRVLTAGSDRTADDYVKPDHEYPAADLGFGTGEGAHTRVKFFVEGNQTTEDPVDIEVVFIFQGDTNTREYFKDKVKVRVSGVKFEKTNELAGFDDQSRPNWLMVPLGGTNQANVLLEPSSLVSSLTLDNDNSGVAMCFSSQLPK